MSASIYYRLLAGSLGSRGSGPEPGDLPDPLLRVDPWDQEVSLLILISPLLGGFIFHLGRFACEDWHVLNTSPSFLSPRLEDLLLKNIMPPRRRPTFSTFRRHQKADQILETGLLVMRPCAHYVASSSLYILSEVSEKCK
jgi:hypothetical protein